MEVRKACTTHVGHDRVTGNTGDGVLGVLLDESTVSGVIERGSTGIRISRTVFPKLDDFITEDKDNRQETFVRIGKWKVRVNVGGDR